MELITKVIVLIFIAALSVGFFIFWKKWLRFRPIRLTLFGNLLAGRMRNAFNIPESSLFGKGKGSSKGNSKWGKKKQKGEGGDAFSSNLNGPASAKKGKNPKDKTEDKPEDEPIAKEEDRKVESPPSKKNQKHESANSKENGKTGSDKAGKSPSGNRSLTAQGETGTGARGEHRFGKPLNFSDALKRVKNKSLQGIFEYLKARNYIKKEILNRAFESEEEFLNFLKKYLVEFLNNEYQTLKTKVSQLRREGKNMEYEGLKLLRVPLKIKVFESTLSEKDFDKVIDHLTIIANDLKKYVPEEAKEAKPEKQDEKSKGVQGKGS